MTQTAIFKRYRSDLGHPILNPWRFVTAITDPTVLDAMLSVMTEEVDEDGTPLLEIHTVVLPA